MFLVFWLTRLAIYWTLGNFSNSLATINLPKSPIFLVKSFLGNFYRHTGSTYLEVYETLIVKLRLKECPDRKDGKDWLNYIFYRTKSTQTSKF